MKAQVVNFRNEPVGEITLNEDIFAVMPREDIIKRVIDWQRAKARAGTHQTKTISEVSGTTKKPFKQKGTGNARQGSLRSAQMRGGGVSHGPVTRSHATKLPKKIRKLGLRHALSAKLAEGKLLIIDNFALNGAKTALVAQMLKNFSAKNFCIVGGSKLESNFALAVKNLRNAVALPEIGANVYDIIRHEYLILSQEAVNALEKRLI